jgi:hypothetical protein
MYLSNRDIKWAIENGRLICVPRPEDMKAGYDETSIDLHLDKVREAYIWDIDSFQAAEDARGSGAPELLIGRFNWDASQGNTSSTRLKTQPVPSTGEVLILSSSLAASCSGRPRSELERRNVTPA